MKRAVLLIVLAIGLAVVGWFVGDRGFFRSRGQSPGSPGAQPASPARASASEKAGHEARGPVALGRIEPAGKVIDVSAVPGDRLESLSVEENAAVKKDAPLAYLDSRALRKLEWEAVQSQRAEAELRRGAEEKAAEARIAAARAALNQARAYELDLKVQESKIGVLQKNLDLARLGQRRLKELKSTDVVSPQEREEQDLAAAKAQAELKAAQTLYDKGKQSGQLGVAAAEADLEAAIAGKNQILSTFSVESLKKREELARAQWERTVLKAPCDGTVLKVFLRPGEILGGTPVLQLADRSRMVVLAEVYEADVKRIREGQKAKVASRAFPSPFDERGLQGTVTRIGKTISRPELQPLDPLAQADRHVIEVRVDLDAEGSKVAADFIHLQAEVQFAPASP
jgi:HlyD family secretion protein